MPNHCINTLAVQDLDPKEWETLHKSFKDKEFPATFVPEPDWSSIPRSDGALPIADSKGGSVFPDGKQDDRWYDWRKKNWGTKWKVFDVDLGEPEPGSNLVVFFTTAWAPFNEECLEQVSKAFPNATFALTYEEPGCDLIGATLAKDGVTVDICGSFSEIRERWEDENEKTIKYYETQYTDEEELWEAVEELWQDNREEVTNKVQATYVALLRESLKAAIEKRGKLTRAASEGFEEFLQTRIKNAVDRLKNAGKDLEGEAN